ncbi:hypothetical protein [Rhodococcus phage REQ1]|uniref:hypothetical protein n=1 Tax=Rhodococcus phage REQ1 TaxID=1109712 RepID=UPI00023EEBFE|nr:hypothetical protein RoPhREQ1_gp29 [Rhodococcus phage REQ1]AEV52025.1 hypothetical protein [Rhodococcus phage REQ1]
MTGIRLSGISIPTIHDQPWREKAKCLGQDWKEYVVEEMPKGRNAPETRAILAQAKCSGCPVKRECAGDALDNHDMGVIRAGVAIPGTNGSEEYRQAVRKLETAAGRVHRKTKRKTVWPRQCESCARSMRPRRTTLDEFPGTITHGAGKLCGTCQMRQWRADKETKES